MHPVIWLALGFLAYGLGELALAAIICRYFPGKIWRLQRVGDTLFRLFRKGPADTRTDLETDTDGYNEKGREGEEATRCPSTCACPLCSVQNEAPAYHSGLTVTFADPDPDSYGVLRGTILGPSHDGIYDVKGPDHDYYVLACDIAPLEGEIIPEGKGVMVFIHPTMSSALSALKGVTFKARVADKKLYYVVEYGGCLDIKEAWVPASDVREL